MSVLKTPSYLSKIRSQKSLCGALRRDRASGKKIVFTNGCFDLLHVGHVRYLDRARRLGDRLVIGLNSDASVRALKGSARPVNAQRERAEVLAALGAVDYVTVFTESTPEKLIRRLCPDVLVKGGDWRPSAIVGGDFVRSRGGSVRSLPFVDGFSTTGTLKKLASSDA